MKKTKFYIYKFTCIENDKVYIGKTHDYKIRFNAHVAISKTPKSKKFQLIHKAIAKYGIKNFKFEIIAETLNENNALILEIECIKQYNSRLPNGYNMTDGGEGTSNRPTSEQTRDKMSKSIKAHWAENPIKRDKHTEETKQKIIARVKTRGMLSDDDKLYILQLYSTGKYTNKDIAEKLNLTIGSIKYVTGYVKKNGIKTVEQKWQRQSKIQKGKKRDPILVEKSRLGSIGKRRSEESKQNISNSRKNSSLKGRKDSDEVKLKKMGASRKYTMDDKIKIYEDYKTNKISVKQLCAKYDISSSTLYLFISQVNKTKA